MGERRDMKVDSVGGSSIRGMEGRAKRSSCWKKVLGGEGVGGKEVKR